MIPLEHPQGDGTRNEPREYRMFPDYTATWPFWGPDGYVGDPQRELGLSPGLLTEVANWVMNWEEMCPAETGWISERHRNAWISRGDELYRWLSEELSTTIVMQPEYRKIFRS